MEAVREGHMTPGSSGNGSDADQGKLRKSMMRFFSPLSSHYIRGKLNNNSNRKRIVSFLPAAAPIYPKRSLIPMSN